MRSAVGGDGRGAASRPPLAQDALRFNGGLFENSDALPLTREQLRAADRGRPSRTGGDVEPAIFGTLLERALDPAERRQLGAHYTPRAYVERLVLPDHHRAAAGATGTAAQAAAVKLAEGGDKPGAIARGARVSPQALRDARCSTPPAAPGTSSM